MIEDVSLRIGIQQFRHFSIFHNVRTYPLLGDYFATKFPRLGKDENRTPKTLSLSED
jgi:hypothetical protein